MLHPHLTGNEHQQITVMFDSVKTHNVNVDLSLCETTDRFVVVDITLIHACFQCFLCICSEACNPVVISPLEICLLPNST